NLARANSGFMTLEAASHRGCCLTVRSREGAAFLRFLCPSVLREKRLRLFSDCLCRYIGCNCAPDCRDEAKHLCSRCSGFFSDSCRAVQELLHCSATACQACNRVL